jgi:hypothetical protein
LTQRRVVSKAALQGWMVDADSPKTESPTITLVVETTLEP